MEDLFMIDEGIDSQLLDSVKQMIRKKQHSLVNKTKDNYEKLCINSLRSQVDTITLGYDELKKDHG